LKRFNINPVGFSIEKNQASEYEPFREFPFESKVFERYSRVEQALLMAIAESYIQGVSTRRMEDLVKSFGLNRLSASEVSRICAILDEKAEEFLKRPIETKIRYLLVDATYFKARYGAQYKPEHC
jgi:putative transposase